MLERKSEKMQTHEGRQFHDDAQRNTDSALAAHRDELTSEM